MTPATSLWTAHTSCPHCEEGTLWQNERTDERFCDACYAALPPANRSTTLDLRDPYDRTYEHYDGSGRVRLIGGYRHAYLSKVNGKEYAIDACGEVTDGLWTPRKRDWSRGDATVDG